MLVTCLIILAGSRGFQTTHIPLSSGAVEALAANLGVEPNSSAFQREACLHLEDTLLSAVYGEDSEANADSSEAI